MDVAMRALPTSSVDGRSGPRTAGSKASPADSSSFAPLMRHQLGQAEAPVQPPTREKASASETAAQPPTGKKASQSDTPASTPEPGSRSPKRLEQDSAEGERTSNGEQPDGRKLGVREDSVEDAKVDVPRLDSQTRFEAVEGEAGERKSGFVLQRVATPKGETQEAGLQSQLDRTEMSITDGAGERRSCNRAIPAVPTGESIPHPASAGASGGDPKAADARGAYPPAQEQASWRLGGTQAEGEAQSQEVQTGSRRQAGGERDIAEAVSESRLASLTAREPVDGGSEIETGDSLLFREAIYSVIPAQRRGYQPAGMVTAGEGAPGAATTGLHEGQRPAATEELRLSTSELNKAVGASGWREELGQRVLWQVGRQEQMAELRLNPPELGSLEIRIKQDGDATSVSFLVQSSSTKEAVEGALPRLRELFGEAGLALSDVEVAERHADQRQDTPADTQSHNNPAPDPGGGQDEDLRGEAVAVAAGVLDAYV